MMFCLWKLSFPQGLSQILITFFDVDDLASTIQSLNDPAMGGNFVPNKMLRALSLTFLVHLLYFFNICLESGSLPIAWKPSILILIYKGKRDSSNPSSYHPIALTSCIAKVTEKMIKLKFGSLIIIH